MCVESGPVAGDTWPGVPLSSDQCGRLLMTGETGAREGAREGPHWPGAGILVSRYRYMSPATVSTHQYNNISCGIPIQSS